MIKELFSFVTDNLMLGFLSYTYENIIPNYGIAIILLTILIKILFYPLTVKQFKSMKMTQKLQPKIKEIQAKYKKNPQKLQQEMMKVWKENNANPLGGCLPALVQLPIFLAVFYSVKSNKFIDMLAEPNVNMGFLWLKDLAQPDAFYILPVLIGLAMFWSQKLMTIDPKQAKLFMFMPAFMAFLSFKMPGGVLLYWAASMIISNIQQTIILKQPDIEIIPAKKISKKRP